MMVSEKLCVMNLGDNNAKKVAKMILAQVE